MKKNIILKSFLHQKNYNFIKKKAQCLGFSLIEVMIATVILSVLSAGMATMIVNQQKSLAFLSKKNELLIFKNSLSEQLGKSSFCTWQLQNLQFDSRNINSVTESGIEVRLPNDTIYSGNDINSTPLAVENEPLIPSASYSPTIDKIRLTGFRTIDSNNFFAKIFISLKREKDKLAANVPLEFPIRISTDPTTPASNKTIIRCNSTSPSSGDSFFPDWPEKIFCNGVVWRIQSEGLYQCFGGGATSTRSGYILFDINTRKISGGGNPGGCAPCTSNLTIDELIDTGLAK